MQRSEDATVRFTVIIPVYNVQNYLPACVKSVVEQPGPADWECILIDDGSTDTCPDQCDAFAAEIPGVSVIHQENRGLAAARNTGLAKARGEWILFLDSDDAWHAAMLPELRAGLDAHPGFDWYIARYLSMDSETGALSEPGEIHFAPGEFESEDYAARVARLYESAHWSVWKYCLRREFLAAHKMRFWPAVRWAEDYPFDLQLLRYANRLCFLDFVMTHYREGRPGSLLNNDLRGLPGHFAGIVAAQRRFALEFSRGDCTPAEKAEIQARMADVFWPQARTAAVRDKAVRHACAPLMAQCKPLYNKGSQCRGRPDWVIFRVMMTAFGPRFALWAAAWMKR